MSCTSTRARGPDCRRFLIGRTIDKGYAMHGRSISQIAYVASVPTDLFNRPLSFKDNKQLDYTLTYAHLFQKMVLHTWTERCGDMYSPHPSKTWTWSVYSVGPDQKPSQYYDLATWMQMPYNSSNGIRSMGDIQWSTQSPPVWYGGSREYPVSTSG